MTRGSGSVATRARGQRSRDGASNSIEEVLRRVGGAQTISTQETLRLYHADKPVCQGCKFNQKDSPNCFCGLAPPGNGSRKQGLWQKVPQSVLDLGVDPALQRRSEIHQPVGLTNLGATCYVNSVLQVLYMNLQFRQGIFAVEPELLQREPVLYQLARVFTELQMGMKDIVDPEEFAKILQLECAIQQDGQEFLKLLLTLLENLLAASGRPSVKSLVQALFRGTFSYVTRCRNCGLQSNSSSAVVDFYELEINVKGFSGLKDSLDDYLHEEVLEGDNKYFCEHCKERVDATRSVKLRSLPPVLSFQLKRFIFVPKTMSKKKVTSRFSFPKSLDLGSRLEEGTGVEQELPSTSYDLSAILVHKGSMATSGHYIAHIKDQRTGEWWQFDDELAVKLGQSPLGESTAASAGGSPPRSSSLAGTGAPQEVKDADQAPDTEDGQAAKAAVNEAVGSLDPDLLTSADAYMLMYTRRAAAGPAASDVRQEYPASALVKEASSQRKRPSVSSEKVEAPTGKRPRLSDSAEQADCVTVREGIANGGKCKGRRTKRCSDRTRDEPDEGVSTMDCEGPTALQEKVTSALDQTELPDPPSFLKEEIAADNQKLLADCEVYKANRAAEEQRVAERKSHVREVLQEAPLAPGMEPFYWISADWMKAWADSAQEPGEIDNTVLLCQHNKVPPAKVALLKRISPQAWTMLQSKYGGGPELSRDDCCEACIREDAKAARSANDFRSTRAAMRQLLDSKQECTHFVSKAWLNLWARRSKADVPVEADANPTEALQCPHGGLIPDNAPGAKRQAIPAELWQYFESMSEEVAPGEAGEAKRQAFPVNTDDCDVCKEEWSIEASKQEEMKYEKSKERAEHEGLYAGRAVPVVAGRGYNLVPTIWLQAWRQYLASSSKGAKQAGAELPPLQDSMQALRCDKHRCLLQHPPTLAFKRNELVQKNLQEEALTVVRDSDWQRLAARWNCSEDLQVVAIPVAEEGTPKQPGKAGDVNSPHENVKDDADDDACMVTGESGADVVCLGERGSEERRALVLLTEPEVCHSCLEERASAQLAQRMTYERGEITVELLRGKEPPLHLREGASEGERRSRRARKASAIGGGRAVLTVSAESTVKQLRLQVWEHLGVSEENQRLGVGSKELTEDTEMLANCSIFPGSQLWLIDTGQHANRDIAEAFGGDGDESLEVEEGFKGTGLLAGALSAPGEGSSGQDAGTPSERQAHCEVDGSGDDGLNGCHTQSPTLATMIVTSRDAQGSRRGLGAVVNGACSPSDRLIDGPLQNGRTREWREAPPVLDSHANGTNALGPAASGVVCQGSSGSLGASDGVACSKCTLQNEAGVKQRAACDADLS